MKRMLIACEFSGVLRRAFRLKGFDCWSCDLLESEDDSPYHFVADVRDFLYIHKEWDLLIAHPPCTRLAQSGVRWLHKAPRGKTTFQLMVELAQAIEFYKFFQCLNLPRIAIENPRMHPYAMNALGNPKRCVIQPHWFGAKAFKETGFELHGLPPLRRTHWMELPAHGSGKWKQWCAVHRATPGPNRWKDRSRTDPHVAAAIVDQWGIYL